MDTSYLKTSEDKYRILIHAGVPFSDISPQTTEKNVVDEIHFSFVIRDSDGKVASQSHPILKVQLSEDDFDQMRNSGSLLEYTYTDLIPSGDYSVSIAALNAAAWKTGVVARRLSLPESVESCFVLAPLMLATSSDDSPVVSSQLRVTEQGSFLYGQRMYAFSMDRNFSRTGTVEGFYQIIFKQQKSGKRHCSSFITFRLYSKERTVISLPTEEIKKCTDNKTGVVSNFFSLPYKNLTSGPYELEFVVWDDDGCQKSIRSQFEIR
jgi:hypothetical protein